MTKKKMIIVGVVLALIDMLLISRFAPLPVYQIILLASIGLIAFGILEFKGKKKDKAQANQQSGGNTLDLFQDLKKYDIKLSNAKIKRNFYKNIPEIKTQNVTKRNDIYSISNFIVIDVETTGLKPATNRIISVSAIRFEDWEPVEIFYTLVNPQTSIPVEATRINHITNDMVVDAPTFSQIAESLSEFIGNSNLVGHNIAFDLAFLYCSGLNLMDKGIKFYDTLQLSQYLMNSSEKTGTYIDYVRNYKLSTLCQHFNIRITNFHNSGVDSYATGLLFEKIVKYKIK